MSQCHDAYEPSDFSPANVAVSGGGIGRHECRFETRVRDKAHLVKVIGSLDWTSQAGFAELIGEHCKEKILIIDLTACRIDAAGSGALVLAIELARERQQQLVLVATDPLQLAVMISTGINVVVPIVSSDEEALTWCQQHGILPWTVRDGTALVQG